MDWAYVMVIWTGPISYEVIWTGPIILPLAGGDSHRTRHPYTPPQPSSGKSG